MSNSNRLFPFLAAFVTFICSTNIYGQNTPYIPYNPNDTPPAKVYTDGENKETIKNTKSSDTIILMKNTISFHPALLVDGTVALGYERVFDKRKKAIRIVLGNTALDKVTYYDSKVEKLHQFYVEADIKFFLSRRSKTAPVGLYASPFVQFRNASYKYHVEDTLDVVKNKLVPVILNGYHSQSFAAGVMLGYTTIVLEMLTLEAYMGIGQQNVFGDYTITYNDVEYKPLETGYFWNNGPLFKLGCSIGVNF